MDVLTTQIVNIEKDLAGFTVIANEVMLVHLKVATVIYVMITDV